MAEAERLLSIRDRLVSTVIDIDKANTILDEWEEELDQFESSFEAAEREFQLIEQNIKAGMEDVNRVVKLSETK